MNPMHAADPRLDTSARRAWSVHLPTTDETCIRLRLRPRGERDPWPFSLAITELAQQGAVGEERFRALGSGHGEPLLASQELRWLGCPLHVETLLTRDGTREAALALPSWDELAATEATEDGFWALVDGFAAAVDAEHGAIVDGEPLEAIPGIENHLAVLLPEAAAAQHAGWRAARYRDLPRSGLAVILR
jgi:hypothetical protein